MQNSSFHKDSVLGIYKKGLFLKIKNRSRRAQVLLTVTRAGGRKLGRERQKERWKRRWGSMFNPLNEIKALYKTPLISIVEFISPSYTTIIGFSDLNAFFSTDQTDCLLAVKVTIIVMVHQKKSFVKSEHFSSHLLSLRDWSKDTCDMRSLYCPLTAFVHCTSFPSNQCSSRFPSPW